MYIFKNELRRHRITTVAIGVILGLFMMIVITIYPAFSDDAQNMMAAFGDLSSFTNLLNIDITQLGSLEGYYGMEHDVLVNLTISVYAAMLGGNLLLKEEREHTSEFLLTHPVSRVRVIAEKLLASTVILLVVLLCVYSISLLTVYFSGQEVAAAIFFKIHLVSFLLYLNIHLLALGLVELVPYKNAALGTFVVIFLYALLVISNLKPDWEFLRWLTPFHYSSTSFIINTDTIPWKYIAANYAISFVFLFLGLYRYTKRDIDY